MRHAEAACRRIGKIDDAAGDVRSAIIDPHHNALTGIEAPHTHLRAESQRAMGRRKLLLVVGLAAGGALAFEWSAIPTGDALFRRGRLRLSLGKSNGGKTRCQGSEGRDVVLVSEERR